MKTNDSTDPPNKQELDTDELLEILTNIGMNVFIYDEVGFHRVTTNKEEDKDESKER